MDETEQTEQSPDEVFMTAVVFESALAALAILLGWLLGPSARALVPDFDFANLWPVFTGILYGCLAAIPILIAVELIRRIPWQPVRELERLTEDGMVKVLLRLRPAELIVISICAGIGEELLFRGWLMYWLLEGTTINAAPSMLELSAALIVSSIVFGLFHPITRLYVVLASLMGLYFGALLMYTENLLVPIAAHAAYDAVQLILTARQHRNEESQL
jgi:membrane protease YdiL (CAAX protease family)